MCRVALVLLCLGSFPAVSSGQSLTRVGVIDVPGPNWGEEKIGVIGLRQMLVVRRLPTAAKPNGSTYAASFRKVYVANTNGKAVTVVNVDTDQIVATLNFDSETGMPQYDSVAKKVYVNLSNTNEIAVIDPATDSVVGEVSRDGLSVQPRYGYGLRAPPRLSALRW